MGKSAIELRAEQVPDYLVPHRTFTGNRPSLSVLLPDLTAYTIGPAAVPVRKPRRRASEPPPMHGACSVALQQPSQRGCTAGLVHQDSELPERSMSSLVTVQCAGVMWATALAPLHGCILSGGAGGSGTDGCLEASSIRWQPSFRR